MIYGELHNREFKVDIAATEIALHALEYELTKVFPDLPEQIFVIDFADCLLLLLRTNLISMD